MKLKIMIEKAIGFLRKKEGIRVALRLLLGFMIITSPLALFSVIQMSHYYACGVVSITLLLMIFQIIIFVLWEWFFVWLFLRLRKTETEKTEYISKPRPKLRTTMK
jgi:hypothetical protein